MSPKHLLIETQDGIRTITLNRPDRRNAFINEMIFEAHAALDEADRDDDVRVIILTGAGSAFSSGADVDAFRRAFEEFKRTGQHTSALDHDELEAFAVAIRRIGKPIICAINGPAVGLGFTLAVACDIRVASEKALMGAIFLRVGLTPEFGSSYNLTRLVGIAKACELVFTARVIGAQEAKEIGLVNTVVPHDELLAATLEMARSMAALPMGPMRISKRNLYSGMDTNLVVQAHEETIANMVCRQAPDHAEGIAAFLEKREPNFNRT